MVKTTYCTNIKLDGKYALLKANYLTFGFKRVLGSHILWINLSHLITRLAAQIQFDQIRFYFYPGPAGQTSHSVMDGRSVEHS